MTPEGKVKAAVNRLLAKYHGVYRYMPVPSGYGAVTLDYLICYNGRFLAIETKAPGKKMTRLQRACADVITAAGGTALLIDGPEGLEQLEAFLERHKNERVSNASSNSVNKT